MRIPVKYDRQLKNLRKFRSGLNSFAIHDGEQGQILSSEGKFKIESKFKLEIREQLNNLLPSVSGYVKKAGIQAWAYHLPSKSEIDFFDNLFRVKDFGIAYINVLDVIDRTIGYYEEKRRQFIFCIINPICWVREIIRTPFHLIGYFGDSKKREKAEFSITGKMYKLIANFIAFIASLSVVLKWFGINVETIVQDFLK